MLLSLVVGAFFIFMTFMRYSLPVLAWVAFAPFLVVLFKDGALRRHIAVLATLVIAFIVTVSKMATAEIPWIPVPMFAIPLAVAYFAAIALAAAAYRRLGPRWAIYTFASMAVVVSWVQYTFTPGSSWGALAHTQLGDLALVQLAALTGIGGISFLVALGSGLAATAWVGDFRVVRTDLAFAVVLLGVSLVYGELRLGNAAPGRTVRVGAVVSPVTHKEFKLAYTNVDTLRALDDELFARTARAANLGAKVIVWNEMATVLSLASESAFVTRGQAFAQQHHVMLLMAYAVVVSTHPFRDVNKYRLYLPDGTLADQYVKRHPVPGDPDAVGTAHAKVVTLDGVDYTGAICYDYGFPQIGRDNARDGGAVALVPSSDWRGIDPEHGRMALLNAVAVGLPMVRPVRAATSIVTDQYGRLIGSMPFGGASDGVLVASVPTQRIPTLYASTGELAPLLALAFCLVVASRLLLALRVPATAPRPQLATFRP